MSQEFEELREKAKSGDAAAQFTIGQILIEGKNVQKDSKEGCKWLEESANAANLSAQVLLAEQYARGEGVSRNYEAAISWYQHAARGGHPDALYKMGLLMILAKKDTSSVSKGEECIRNSATKNNVKAQFELGLIYLRGSNTFHIDGEEAVRWFKKAAEKGHLPSINLLGYIFANGTADKKIKINEDEAIKYWKVAADKNYPEAQYNLANLYLKKASELWEKSATAGFQKSRYMVNMLRSHDIKSKR